MGRETLPVLTLPIPLAGTVAVERFVTYGGAQAGAAANTIGVAQTNGVAGQVIPVIADGLAAVEAGAAIAAGVAVETDAQGRAITRTSGPIVGRMFPGEVAVAAGDRVVIRLIPN